MLDGGKAGRNITLLVDPNRGLGPFNGSKWPDNINIDGEPDSCLVCPTENKARNTKYYL